MKRSVLCLLLLVLSASAGAQTTNPIRYTWIAEACENWNCAAAALVLANGEPDVIALPTGIAEHPWVVLRRVAEGSIYIPEDAPFQCEVFEAAATAFSRFDGIEECHAPLILNVPDGRMVVMSLQRCHAARRRVMR